MNFYADFKKLAYSLPRCTVNSRSAENSAFGDYLFRCKNIYLGFFLTEAVDCFYSDNLNKASDCIDCSHLSASELCYECVDCTGLYNCSFLQDCHNCSFLNFCFDCMNCKNCFGSFGLRQQQFCIFNKVYSEEDYYKKVNQLKKTPPHKILEILEPEFDKQPRLFSRLIKGGENSYGDYIYFTTNCFNCFNVRNVDSCMYVTNIQNSEHSSSNSVDCDFTTQIEGCYECENINICNNCNYLSGCVSCWDMEYGINCYNCQNCFGCVYLENKQYCILNKQFTREEYKVAITKIKGNLKEAGEYGKTLAEVLK